MARLIVVTAPELATGFRLAGVRTVEAPDAERAAHAIAELERVDDVGVLAVHAPYFEALDPAVRKRLAASSRPVVVTVPDGLESEAPDARRRRLVELLQRAVGLRLRLPTEGT